MSRSILIAGAMAALLGTSAAHATLMRGTFAGTMDSGTDTTGVFGTASANLAGDTITGTFTYDTAKFGTSVSGGVNTATGSSTGALSVTITINGHSHTFTDHTSAAITLDTNLSDANYANSNVQGTSVSENVTVDLENLIASFVNSTSLTAPFSTNDPADSSSTSTFFINDTGPSLAASGSFTVASLTVQAVASPEPMSLALVGVGVLGIAGARRRGRA